MSFFGPILFHEVNELGSYPKILSELINQNLFILFKDMIIYLSPLKTTDNNATHKILQRSFRIVFVSVR